MKINAIRREKDGFLILKMMINKNYFVYFTNQILL
jgi:hypothetical protein